MNEVRRIVIPPEKAEAAIAFFQRMKEITDKKTEEMLKRTDHFRHLFILNEPATTNNEAGK